MLSRFFLSLFRRHRWFLYMLMDVYCGINDNTANDSPVTGLRPELRHIIKLQLPELTGLILC
jgi:hypothetical protein